MEKKQKKDSKNINKVIHFLRLTSERTHVIISTDDNEPIAHDYTLRPSGKKIGTSTEVTDSYTHLKIKINMKKTPAAQLASIRWKKEKPDPEYFRKLGRLSAAARKRKKYENSEIPDNEQDKE